ncbi:uncharacterized protein BXZ73DRAFT_93229 [Epithele typhae]|uniref:uncharacterized protein n=1 Tax=Epithele typhae TaxID=378194 RepID=UPI0020087DAC|nr:uncharacterized protein BXZ73DRAFT_93229 [Epithele typhae]KAH9912259.1 hypothetical protein BXZ73DRAFT_93229 [Epithele typhae]
MNTVTTSYVAVLPPTSNTLDGRQRARLIRSTRKLGAVLGATPLLLEGNVRPFGYTAAKPLPSPPKRDRKRRQGSVFGFAPPTEPSSSTSLALPRTSTDSQSSVDSMPSLPTPQSFARHVREKSKYKGKSAPLPAPLVLRLNARHPPRPRPLHPLRPPQDPHHPRHPTATETRRKRLAKLKRTLGENVPPELIMPRNRHAHSVASPTEPSRPKRAAPPPQRADSYVPSHPSADAVAKTARRRSLSVDHYKHGVGSPVPVARPAPASPAHAHGRSPSTPPAMAMADRGPGSAGAHGWTTGAKSWMGEWNRKDIRDVQNQLRNLRLR